MSVHLLFIHTSGTKLYCIVSEAYAPPANFLSLGSQQFMRNLNAILGEYKDEEDISKYNINTTYFHLVQNSLRKFQIQKHLCLWHQY